MKLNKYYFLLLLIIFSLATRNYGTGIVDKSDLVARIGKDYPITFQMLQKYVTDWMYYAKYPDPKEAYQVALNDMILNQMKQFDFFKNDLQNNKDLVRTIQRNINEELIVEYFNTQILAKYCNETAAKKVYPIIGKEVSYRQIVLFIRENSNQKQIDSVKEIALKIKSQIQQGISFEELVKKYSQHHETVVTKGLAIPISWDQSLTDPLSRDLFDLKKNTIQILEAYNAFYIVEVTGIKFNNLEPYNKIKDDISLKLKKGYYDAALHEYETEKNKLINSSSIEWNDKAIKQIVAWSQSVKFFQSTYRDTLLQNISKGNNLNILTYMERKIDYREFLRLLDEVLIMKSSEKTDEKEIKKFLIDALQTELIVEKALGLNLLKNVFNAKTENPILKDRIIRLYNQQMIESQVQKPSENDLKKFYNEQKDSLYFQLEKINLFVMTYSDQQKADEDIKKINTGIPFEKITGSYYVKTYVIDKQGNYQTFWGKEKPFLAEAGFKLKLDEVAGPIEFNDPEKGKQYAIIKCAARRPQKQLTYDDVNRNIEEDYIKLNTQIIANKIAAQLKKKYSFKIFNNVLEKKVSSLK